MQNADLPNDDTSTDHDNGADGAVATDVEPVLAAPDVDITEQTQYRMRLRPRRSIVLPRNTDHDYLATSGVDEVYDFLSIDIEAIIEPLIQARMESENLFEPRQPQEQIDSLAEENTDEDDIPQSSASQLSLEAAAGDSSSATGVPCSSPPRKRLRKTQHTPKVKSINDNDDDVDEDDDDDGFTCPICFERWEMSGDHRLVSLRCGHLYGEKCIRRWLDENMRQSGIRTCPQCKKKVMPKDIRYIYAKRVRVIDRSEEYQLQSDLQKERILNQKLQVDLTTLRVSYKTVQNSMEVLVEQNERMKNLLQNGGGAAALSNNANKSSLFQTQYKLSLENTIYLSHDSGSRIMIYSDQHSQLIISQKSSQNLFPGHGLRFLDVSTFRATQFLYTCLKPLRDICLNGDQRLVGVTYIDKHMKLFDLRTNQMATTFSPAEKDLFACAIDRDVRENSIYLGANDGTTFLYDIRFPQTVVEEYTTEGDTSPVINIEPMPATSIFPHGGVLVCKLQSLWLFEYTSTASTIEPTQLNVQGHFVSMRYDSERETLLVSARNSSRYTRSRYIFGKLTKMDGNPVFEVQVTFFGSTAAPLMSRASQVTVDTNSLVCGYIQDERTLALFDTVRQQRLQSVPVQDVIYDTRAVYLQNSINYLAALSENKCRMYKVTPRL